MVEQVFPSDKYYPKSNANQYYPGAVRQQFASDSFKEEEEEIKVAEVGQQQDPAVQDKDERSAELRSVKGFQGMERTSSLFQNVGLEFKETGEGLVDLASLMYENPTETMTAIAEGFPAAVVESYARWGEAADKGVLREAVFSHPVQFAQDMLAPLQILTGGGSALAGLASKSAKVSAGGAAKLAKLSNGLKSMEKVADVGGILTDPFLSAPIIAGKKIIGTGVGKFVDTKPIATDYVEALDDRMFTRADEIEQGLIDQYHSIEVAEKKVLGKDTPLSQMGSAQAAMINMPEQFSEILTQGTPIWEGGLMKIKVGSEGLLTPLAKLGDKLDDWGDWMVGERALELAEKKGIPIEKLDKNAQAKADLGRGDQATNLAFKAAKKGYDTFRNDLLDFAESSGLLTREAIDVWKKNDFYIPFYRLDGTTNALKPTGKKGLAGQSARVFKLKGSDKDINNPISNLMLNVHHLFQASVKNHAAQTSIKNLRGVPGLMTKQDMGKSVGLAPVKGLLGELKKQDIMDIDPKVIPDSDLEKILPLHTVVPPKGDNVISAIIDGKKEYYRVHEPLLYKSLTSITAVEENTLVKPFKWAKRALTAGVTITPDFIARNFLRDAVATSVISGTNPMKSVRGAGSYLNANNNELVKSLRASGATFTNGYNFDSEPDAVKALVRKKWKEAGIEEKDILNTSKKLGRFAKDMTWGFYKKLQEAAENASRIEVARKVKANGGSDFDAAYAAKDVLNFQRRGDFKAMQYITQAVPFFNARLQGLDKLRRAVRDDTRNIIVKKMAGIALASTGLAFINSQDEVYNDLPEWVKDSYIMVPRSITGDTKVFFPKPFEIGALTMTIPERMYRALAGDDSSKIWAESMGQMIMETFEVPMPQDAQLWKPALEVATNKKSFTGAPVVPRGLVDVSASEQYNYRTSPTAIEVGQLTGASPMQVEHMVKGHFGAFGGMALAASDLVVRELFDHPDKPAMQLTDFPLVKAFIGADTPRTTKQSSQFYEMFNEVFTLHKDIKKLQKTSPEKALQKKQKNIKKLNTKKFLKRINDQIRGVNQKIERVNLSKNLNGEQKTQEILKLQETKNALFKQVDLLEGIF